MAPELRPIDPKVPRWEPSADPSDIVVPGLDTSAPPYDQIEQIEQLITIKLQNIDANFAKMQHIMADRVLPAVKRYSIGVQPVREAARFWTTFYEQAAEIRIPTYEDYSAEQEPPEDASESTHQESEATSDQPSVQPDSDSEPELETPHGSRMFAGDRTPSDLSFAPGQGAVSSTPATVSRARSMRKVQDSSFASQATDPMPSWTASLESPIRQLNRDIQSLSDGNSIASFSAVEGYDASADVTERAIRPSTTPKVSMTADKGKGREPSQPLRHNVLRKNANVSSHSLHSSQTSPLKFKPRTPAIKTLNPYLPPDSNPSDWQGVVDLKDPNIISPQKRMPGSAGKFMTFKPPSKPAFFGFGRTQAKTPPPGEDDDTFDDNFGMSPPVMTDYARLPTLGRTPKKEAAQRIMQGLVDLEQRRAFPPPSTASRQRASAQDVPGSSARGYGTESSMSSMPTPPSMTRYGRPSYIPPTAYETSSSVADASLDSMMRRVGLEVPEYSKQQQPSTSAPPPPAPEPAPVSRPPVFAAPAPSATVQPSRPPVFTLNPASSLRSLGSSSAIQPPSQPEPEPPRAPQPRTPEQPQPQYDFYDDEVIGRGAANPDDSMDSMDSFDDYQDPDAPPGGFAFATDEQAFDDDSFDSSIADDDDIALADSGTAGQLQQFMGAAVDEDAFDEDSFDDDNYGDEEQETVFGVPPRQRLQQQAQQGGNVRMMGGDFAQDTIGLEQQFARAGWVQETPTPWNANARG